MLLSRTLAIVASSLAWVTAALFSAKRDVFSGGLAVAMCFMFRRF